MLRQLKWTLLLSAFIPLTVAAENKTIDSFSRAKRLLHNDVYSDHRITLYCNASYSVDKKVDHPAGFSTEKYIKRSKRIEWEHVVPAENFGRAFSEWRDGHPDCVNRKGESFRGRKCAEKVNMEYRFMQADMFNLFPAIGAVNAMRSNYSFTMLPGRSSDFGNCQMKIEDRKAEPTESSRGRIARTYLYMDQVYSKFSMSSKTRKLMEAWDRMYPVSEWECERADRIGKIQGSINPVMESRCGKSSVIGDKVE